MPVFGKTAKLLNSKKKCPWYLKFTSILNYAVYYIFSIIYTVLKLSHPMPRPWAVQAVITACSGRKLIGRPRDVTLARPARPGRAASPTFVQFFLHRTIDQNHSQIFHKSGGGKSTSEYMSETSFKKHSSNFSPILRIMGSPDARALCLYLPNRQEHYNYTPNRRNPPKNPDSWGWLG